MRAGAPGETGIAAAGRSAETAPKALTDRVLAQLDAGGEDALALLLNETFDLETKRLRRKRGDPRRAEELGRLREMRRAFPHSGSWERRRMARVLVRAYAEEIHGHFSPALYSVVTRVLPRGLGVLLNPQSPGQAVRFDLSSRIRVGGALEQLSELVQRGVVILVPTHLSNLDSPLVGWGLHHSGLPPMIYGAGLNLFENGVLARFMDGLGAYTVDREKRHRLYKLVLKTYSVLALERRWHSLFFPGGTRVRSGAVETRLKKGLLGTGLQAFIGNLRSGAAAPDVWIVPLNINYHLVLEAETLVEDHLKEWGKNRYIIVDDAFSRPRDVASFALRTLRQSNLLDLHFGRALDVFGNDVDGEGRSLGPAGQTLARAPFVQSRGEICEEKVRDRLYTDALAGRIVERFLEGNQICVTHLVAGALHELVRARNPQRDVYQRLLVPEAERTFEEVEVLAAIDRLLAEVRGLAARGRVRQGPGLEHSSAPELLQGALDMFQNFHAKPAVVRRGSRVGIGDGNLTLYYRNRLLGYGIIERERVYQDVLPPTSRGGGEAAVAASE